MIRPYAGILYAALIAALIDKLLPGGDFGQLALGGLILFGMLVWAHRAP